MSSANFSGTEFVRILLEVGGKEAVDASTGIHDDNLSLPDDFDPVKFKRGQAVFHKYFISMFLGKLLGLTFGMAEPKANKILQMTNMSSEPKTAHKRYASTVRNMLVWYNNDCKPGGRTWKSMAYIRNQHGIVSQSAEMCGLGRITQKEMAFAQWGFMGVIVCLPEDIGIHYCSEEEMGNFVYFWKVLGHFVGLKDRYNICRDSLQETREICFGIMEVLDVEIQKMSDDYKKMTYALINGLRAIAPLSTYEKFMIFSSKIMDRGLSRRDTNLELLEVETKENSLFGISTKLRRNSFRIVANTIYKCWLWFILRCPVLAYFMFD